MKHCSSTFKPLRKAHLLYRIQGNGDRLPMFTNPVLHVTHKTTAHWQVCPEKNGCLGSCLLPLILDSISLSIYLINLKTLLRNRELFALCTAQEKMKQWTNVFAQRNSWLGCYRETAKFEDSVSERQGGRSSALFLWLGNGSACLLSTWRSEWELGQPWGKCALLCLPADVLFLHYRRTGVEVTFHFSTHLWEMEMKRGNSTD